MKTDKGSYIIYIIDKIQIVVLQKNLILYNICIMNNTLQIICFSNIFKSFVEVSILFFTNRRISHNSWTPLRVR